MLSDLKQADSWSTTKLRKRFLALVAEPIWSVDDLIEVDTIDLDEFDLVQTQVLEDVFNLLEEDTIELVDKLVDDEDDASGDEDGGGGDEDDEDEDVDDEDEDVDDEDEDVDDDGSKEDAVKDLQKSKGRSRKKADKKYEDEALKVGDWVWVKNPQYPEDWVGQIKEVCNKDYAIVVALDDREWEEAFEFMTKTKPPKGFKSKVVRLTREEVVAKTIRSLKKAVKKAEIIKKADVSYSEQGGRCTSNEKKTAGAVDLVTGILISFDVVKVDGEKVSLLIN